VAEGVGHRILVLQQQPVPWAAAAAVELDAGGQQRAVGVDEGRVVALPQQAPGRLGPPQGMDVAQAAATLLQVGLEEEGHLTGLLVAGPHPRRQLAQPPLRPLLPLAQGLGGQVLGEALVAGQVPDLQERRGRVEVVGGEGEGLAHRAHGVAELHALVPDRVPEPVGQGADVGPPGVEEQHVDVGLEAQLRPPVAADGDEGHVPAPVALPHRGEELGQPGVDEVAVGPAQIPPDERGVLGQRGAGGRQLHHASLRAAMATGSQTVPIGGA
jgi:hypothetical protein